MIGDQVVRCDVLFLIRSMGRGGAERQLSLLARSLQARGLDVVVAVFYSGGELESELKEAGIELLDLGKAGRWSNVGVMRRLIAYIRRRRPRVLHSYMPAQNLMALMLKPFLRRYGCSVVCGIRTALSNSWRYTKMGGVVDFIHSYAVGYADGVISNSARALTGVSGQIPQGRRFVIPNGVETERFVYSESARSAQRAIWGLGPEAVAIGLVGRLDPVKNAALAIDALSLILSEQPKAVLVLVGDGPADYRDQVILRAQRMRLSDSILWVGSTGDLSAAYSALDILCLCSIAEGFPNVVAEAMCVGLPCVVTDVGDASLLLGERGWVVKSNDARELADALLEACRVLPNWDRGASRRRMVAEFSVDALSYRTLLALAPFLGDPA